jgi:hypothetical protein
MNKESKDKTAFFIRNGKKNWNSMPMGATNAHAFFVAMLARMEMKWNQLYEKHTKLNEGVEWERLKTRMEKSLADVKAKRKAGAVNGAADELPTKKEAEFDPTWERPIKPTNREPKPGSAVIVNDIILFAHTGTALLSYFIRMVEAFQHYRVTVKLRKYVSSCPEPNL